MFKQRIRNALKVVKSVQLINKSVTIIMLLIVTFQLPREIKIKINNQSIGRAFNAKAGSNRTLNQLIRQSKCGPVALPLDPTAATT